MSDDITKVIFRKWPDGDVIALFPEDPGTNEAGTCDSYMHVGQHGAASYGLVYDTRLATEEEYASLKRELEAPPYEYKLKVYKRITRSMIEENNRKRKEWK